MWKTIIYSIWVLQMVRNVYISFRFGGTYVPILQTYTILWILYNYAQHIRARNQISKIHYLVNINSLLIEQFQSKNN